VPYKRGFLYRVSWVDLDGNKRNRSYQIKRSAERAARRLLTGYLVNENTDCEYFLEPVQSVSIEVSEPIQWNPDSFRMIEL
jgi:hypothetical protein